MTKDSIRIALLDLNNNHPNQGFGNIKDLTQKFREDSEDEIEIDIFDVRFKNEMPQVKDYDIFISSGGPGNPHRQGDEWEGRYASFLDGVWEHNLESEDKKYLFLVCHSFQLAVIHWGLATINRRHSYSFGVLPVHKTKAGKKEFLFENLPDPFYAIESRAFQCVQPKHEKLKKLGMEILALEKIRPHVKKERAVEAIRFSAEIFGTQFHPEADPEGFLANLKDKDNRKAMIANYGLEKYRQTLERVHDDDKIKLTQSQIIPRFLQDAAENIRKHRPEWV